jgi:hypothetical protein
VENRRLYERIESVYQHLHHYQARHRGQLLPWERSWLSQSIQELEYYLTKLSHGTDEPSARTPPASAIGTAQLLRLLAEHTTCMTEHTVRLARTTIQAARQNIQVTQSLLQAMRDDWSQAPAINGDRTSVPAGFQRRGGGHSTSLIPPQTPRQNGSTPAPAPSCQAPDSQA